MDYFDITPIVSEALAVFPGDVPFGREVLRDMKKGADFSLSAMRSTLHLGAHVDAPNHYDVAGCDIAKRDLAFYLGPAQVVRMNKRHRDCRLTAADFADVAITQPRLLIYTGSYPDPNVWQDDFMALSPELIHHLAKHGVKLVGIDTPSVDPASAKELVSHHAIYQHDMAILEGIVLNTVPAGDYTLLALPLAIQGGDASPVRALLFEKGKLPCL